MGIVNHLGIALVALATQGVSAQSIGPSPPPPARPSTQAQQPLSDVEAVFQGADAAHQRLRASTAQSLSRGEACAALMRAGKLPKTTMAQYRCIVAGEGLSPAAAGKP